MGRPATLPQIDDSKQYTVVRSAESIRNNEAVLWDFESHTPMTKMRISIDIDSTSADM
jgi:hypothetical protein